MVTREKKVQRYFKDVIHLLLRMKCPSEEINCTTEGPVGLRKDS